MNNSCIINVTRSTGNQSSLFQIKDNVKHCSCISNEGSCFCGENHVGESVRYVTLKWTEYKDLNEKSEPAEDFPAENVFPGYLNIHEYKETGKIKRKQFRKQF